MAFTDKITSEHADKPKFVATVSVTTQQSVDLINLCNQFPSVYDVNTAVGNQLDVVGQWVNVSRQLTVPLTGVYFTLDTAGLGLDSGILMGPFDPSTGLTSLPDNYYRLIIQAKILDNHWDGSKSQAYALANIVYAAYGYNLFIVDNSNLTMDLGLLGPTAPPPIVQALLTSGKLNLKPAGIHINNYIFQAVPGPLFALDLNNSFFAGLDTGHLAVFVTNP